MAFNSRWKWGCVTICIEVLEFVQSAVWDQALNASLESQASSLLCPSCWRTSCAGKQFPLSLQGSAKGSAQKVIKEITGAKLWGSKGGGEGEKGK